MDSGIFKLALIFRAFNYFISTRETYYTRKLYFLFPTPSNNSDAKLFGDNS